MADISLFGEVPKNSASAKVTWNNIKKYLTIRVYTNSLAKLIAGKRDFSYSI